MATQCAAVIADSDRIGLDDLRSSARGTAYVEAIDVRAEHTLVRLAYPFARHVELTVPTTPDPAPVAGIRRPLAVQVRTGEVLDCSVLDRAETGPTRRPISLRQALAFASAGVHTVFLAE